MSPQPMTSTGATVVAILVLGVVWITLAIVIPGVLFDPGKDAAFKRKWHPWYFASLAAIQLSAIAFLIPIRVLPAVAVVVALSTILLIRNTKFCDDCGTTISYYHTSGTWQDFRFCPECGGELEEVSRPFWSLGMSYSLSGDKRCPSCRLEYPRGRRWPRYHFCPSCGSKLSVGSKHGRAKGARDDFLA